MIACSVKLPIGFAKSLSLEYNVRYWNAQEVNPFDLMQDAPSVLVIDISDINNSLIKVLNDNPYIKVILQTQDKDISLPKNKVMKIDYIYGLDIFKPRKLTNNKFNGVVVGDFNLLSDNMKEFCLNKIELGELTTFGNGWTHTGNNGIARNPYQIFDNAEYVVYPYNKPSDELIEALYYNNCVFSELKNDYTININHTSIDDMRYKYNQDIISKEYNYVSLCDKMTDFLNLPKNSFTIKLEKNVSNS